MYNKAYIDGCFDGYHYGHVNALYQAKQRCKILTVATHTNAEIERAKANVIFDYEERYKMLSHCRFIDVLLDDKPYNPSTSLLDEIGCEVYFHGDDVIYTKDGNDVLKEIREAGRLAMYPRTNGISSTDLLYRMSRVGNNEGNKDVWYMKYLLSNIEPKNRVHGRVLYIKEKWDFLNGDHIDYITELRDKYKPDCCVIELEEDTDVTLLNMYERAITVSSLKMIDKVVLPNTTELEYLDVYEVIYVNKDDVLPHPEKSVKHVNKPFVNIKKDKMINYIRNHKYMYASKLEQYYEKYNGKKARFEQYWVSGLYLRVIKRQLETLFEIIQTIGFSEKDMIIFDIDEVVLNNLMYNGYSYNEMGYLDDKTYNYDTGLNPCVHPMVKKIFDHLHHKNIAYSFVTGRRDYIRKLTEDNLLLEGFGRYTYLMTCPNSYIGDISKYKQKARDQLYNYGYNIVLCVGDQISDISGDNVGMAYLIQNPFYITK